MACYWALRPWAVYMAGVPDVPQGKEQRHHPRADHLNDDDWQQPNLGTAPSLHGHDCHCIGMLVMGGHEEWHKWTVWCGSS